MNNSGLEFILYPAVLYFVYQTIKGFWIAIYVENKEPHVESQEWDGIWDDTGDETLRR